MSASKLDPSTYEVIFNNEFFPGSFELHDAGKQASTEVSDSAPPDPRNALGIYDGQWITLFLAGPRKWTRSSAPLFHSVLFAAKRKQWRNLAPRQAPNKVPVLCSAPRGSEHGALSGQQRAVACDDRPAVTCCPGASHGHVSKRKITPFDFYLRICSLFWKIQGRSSTLRILLDSDMSVV